MNENEEKGNLFLVATPIGNLEDITFRAINILKNVDLIAAEDTRQTLKLLNHYEIAKPLISYHRHNEDTRSDILIEKLNEGKNIAVVTDAGTPGSNKKWNKSCTNSRCMCNDKCINCIRVRYKGICFLRIFAFK